MKYAITSEKGLQNELNRSAYLLRVAKKEDQIMGMAVICDGIGYNDVDAQYASHYIVHRLEKIFDDLKKKQDIDLKQEISSIYQNLAKDAIDRKVIMDANMSVFYFFDNNCSLFNVGFRKLFILNQNDQKLYDHTSLNNGREITCENFKWNENDAVALFSESIQQDCDYSQIVQLMTNFMESNDNNSVDTSLLTKKCTGDITALFYSRT